MNKIYRVLGKRGRITIPYEIRQRVGLGYNDILSFTESNDNTVIVKREKICDNCKACHSDESDPITLESFLDELTPQEQRAALIHLSVKWAEQQNISKGDSCYNENQNLSNQSR